ncbi:hypothetical protein BH11PLA2_BH11PLA2_32710 [soil metagenome]
MTTTEIRTHLAEIAAHPQGPVGMGPRHRPSRSNNAVPPAKVGLA